MSVTSGRRHRQSSCSDGYARTASNPFSVVQIDGLVVLNLIKHFEQEGGIRSPVPVQGVLVGLLCGDVLEITNSFSFPRQNEDDPEFDEISYQKEMVKNLRRINVDHLQVGWYQSSVYGYFISKSLVEGQYAYQHSVEESVCLIYDPSRTHQGSLGLKAFRLKPLMMKVFTDNEVNNDMLIKNSISCEGLLEEVPIKIFNSHLINCLLSQFTEPETPECTLNLGYSFGLEKTMRMLLDQVDKLSFESNRHLSYHRTHMKQQQQRQQYQQKKDQENLQRAKRGEEPLPQEDIDKLYKLPAPPSRLDSLLLSSQAKVYCDSLSESSSQGFGKLFMAEAIHSS